jgi:hypothetical protein
MAVMSDQDPQLKTEDQPMPLPPPSFALLVVSLRAQAEMQLGLMRYSDEDEKAEPDLPIARHTIDLMAVLLEKTKGNLSLEEQRLLENSVTELRFRFVQVMEEVGRAAAQKA